MKPVSASKQTALSELVIRYRDTVSSCKKGHQVERIVLNAFLRDPICRKWADAITPADFAAYRDQRLLKVCSNTLRREFSTLHNLFQVARREWGIAISSNPLTGLRLVAQFERDIMLARQREGIAKAKKEGRYKGRAPTAWAKADQILALASAGMKKVEIARQLDLSLRSVFRVLGSPSLHSG
ncbi:recombinase family protein [Nordella sp. HKS 07]|uniref:recombinase family protein n=1 Tax=Nordella sp. HKS 07 TaxID=2712222 RepID=UPI0013E0FB1B|nr:recombinase family protein [Nordella sp. HKS 07]QIG50103.1 recombinase family protein [Nordella sp. HKS 07]